MGNCKGCKHVESDHLAGGERRIRSNDMEGKEIIKMVKYYGACTKSDKDGESCDCGEFEA